MTIDYKQLKVEELRMMLLKDSNGLLTEEDVDNIKGKSALVEAHEKLVSSIAQSLETSKPFTKDDVIEPEPPLDMSKIPKYTDHNWEDFLLSQLQPHELENGYPKVNGLRRLVETFLGEIISSGPVEVNSTQEPDRPGKAIVTFKISIAWTRDIASGYLDLSKVETPIREYRAVASSWRGNTDDKFVAYAEAIAETRAEARALRRALRISKISSDELTNKNTALVITEIMDTNTMVADDKITDTQKKVIESMCDRLNIDMYKFINNGLKQYGNNMDLILRDTASKMIQALNDYQNSSDNSATIPAHLLKG